MNHRLHIDRDRHSNVRQSYGALKSEAKFFTFFQVTFMSTLHFASGWNILETV